MSPDQAPPQSPAPHAEEYRVAPEPPPAKEHISRWPGWIWSIPIAAIAIVAWLAFKQITSTGPAVTVTFQSANGVQAGNTQVQYNGMKVGDVDAVHLAKDLSHVDVVLRLDSDMDGHLGPATQFWISGASPSLSNLSSLKSIIAGPTIQIAPAEGKTQTHFTGLTEEPVLPEKAPGRHFVLSAEQRGNLERGTKLYFQGEAVGVVELVQLQSDRQFQIGVFVRQPYDAFVHTNTRFWDAGGAQLSMQGGPHLQIQSALALLQGAIAFDNPPGSETGPEAPPDHQFSLFKSKDDADDAPGPLAVTYRVQFDATGGGLTDNASVQLAGKRIGTVEKTALVFDPDSGAVQEQATLALEPDLMPLEQGSWTDPRQQMDALMNKLIGRGLRAQLGSSIPLIGASQIELAFVGGESDATLEPGNPPEIPSTSGGGGIQGILTAVNKITGKLDSLPLDQIAQNIHTITSRAADLSKSPELKQTLENLDKSVSSIQHVTATAEKQVPQIITQLRNVADQADATIKSAHGLLDNQSGVTQQGIQTAGLSQTLYQLSEAARAIRELADYLDQHPSAIIRGRS